MTTIAQGSIYTITDVDRVVRCAVKNSPDVTPTQGAEAAGEMQRFLLGRVISPASAYRGLIFDVREGPAVFGPDTRAALEQVFCAAEQSRMPLVALVGPTAMQRLQFTSLSRECAREHSNVVDRLEDAVAWIATRRDTARRSTPAIGDPF